MNLSFGKFPQRLSISISLLALATLVPSSPVFSASLSISNLTVASGQAYVVASSLQTGGTVYRDRAYTFKAVPTSVQGAAYIQTANGDKAATNSNFLSFTVNQPVSVYVAHGDRITSKPSWLSTFTDTGTNLVTSDATFSLFVRAFPAGTITLGGNASGGCCSMYSVIVKSGSGGTTTTPTTTTPTTTTPTTTPPSTSGNTYFVAAGNGNDGNSGTQQSPFLTLERGMNVLLPGDTLFVRGGTYESSFPFLRDLPNGNSWSQPVTIKRFQQEKVVFTAATGRSPIRFAVGSHYIIVDGFILDGRGGNAGIITGEDSHHIRILNSEIMNAPHSGILTNTGSSFFEFVNLRIHDNGSSHLDHGMYIVTSNHLVKDCLIYRNAGWGISNYSGIGLQPGNNLIMNNKVYQNATSGDGAEIGIYNGAGNSVINNLVWSTRIGIVINYGASQTNVYNNTIYKGAYGILVGDSSSGTKVFNNIISSSAIFGLYVYQNSKNSQIKNNLIYNSGTRDILNQDTTTTFSKNIEGNNYNPRLQNPENFDFHLQSGSPAIDAGLGINEVRHDFDYISRPRGSSHDIGAHER